MSDDSVIAETPDSDGDGELLAIAEVDESGEIELAENGSNEAIEGEKNSDEDSVDEDGAGEDGEEDEEDEEKDGPDFLLRETARIVADMAELNSNQELLQLRFSQLNDEEQGSQKIN